MLPRVAPTTGTLQPSLAPQGNVPVDAGRPQLSAAALANLRAELLLRLIETMLRHIPRGPEGAAGRNLLESLFAALKSLPVREGEGGRKLADLLSRLPPDLRPAADKLVTTALSSLPTRSIAVLLRNPEAPEVQKLAVLLAASLADAEGGETPASAARQPQRFAGLTVQQLAAVNRHGMQQAAQAAGGDARTLQATLKRIFDLDGARQQPASGTALAGADGADEPPPLARPATADRTPADKAGARLPAETPARATGSGQSEAAAQTPSTARQDGTVPARSGDAADTRTVPDVMQAVTRKASPEVLMQALVRLVENLSEEEAQVLRTLLDRPLETAAGPARPARDPALPMPGDADPETTAAIARADDADPETAQAGPVRRETETAPAVQRPVIAAEEPRIGARISPEAAQAAAAQAETAVAISLPLREGIPLAFVPYLTAEDDLESFETEEIQEEEAAGEDEDRGTEGEEGDEPEAEAETDEPESADMAARRRKTDDLVARDEPGLAFPVRPGDYWT